jgi:SAM-dependent methyltransferase
MSSAPQGSQPPPDLDDERAREVAQSFGTDAERYDRARPRYPDVMVQHIMDVSPGPDVLDVGIGTGILARQFAAHGGRVSGVDPDERMAGVARRHGFEVEIARFEEWDPAGRRFDAVVAGQAWHWVDAAAGASKAAEVLRPDGRLAVFWNTFEPPPALGRAFTEVYERVLPGSPFARAAAPGLDAYDALGDRAVEGMREAGGFGEPERWHFEWEHTYTRESWLDQVPTNGGMHQLPAGTLAELLDGLGLAIDAVGGRFMMHYATKVVIAELEGYGETAPPAP